MGSNSDPRNKPDQGQQQPGASSLDDNEIDDIAQRCNTNRDNVKAAIKKVGNDRSAVERELGRQ